MLLLPPPFATQANWACNAWASQLNPARTSRALQQAAFIDAPSQVLTIGALGREYKLNPLKAISSHSEFSVMLLPTIGQLTLDETNKGGYVSVI
jgi:hypothetical protein